MKNTQKPTGKTDKTMAWLQILLGIFFLSTAAYRYITHGYDFKAINRSMTIIFGIVLPLTAVGRLALMNKKQDNNMPGNWTQLSE